MKVDAPHQNGPPFSSFIDYNKFVLAMNKSDILNEDIFLAKLRSISDIEYEAMYKSSFEASGVLQWANFPHDRCDAFNLLLKELEIRAAQLPMLLN